MNNIEIAKSAIDDVFSDTSVSPEETLRALEELRDDISMRIEAVESQLTKFF